MKSLTLNLKCAVTAFALSTCVTLPLAAQDARLDPLFDRLKSVDPADAQAIEDKIWLEWSKSGSPAMDLLLDRGRDAMEAEDYPLAIAHFSALIDHAPGFSEGYNARATAFFQNGQYGPALEDIRRTLNLEPRHFGALSGLAIILQELGYREEALEAFRAVRDLHPHREMIAEQIAALEAEVSGKPL